MTVPTLAAERTALAWRRTALAAAACALLLVNAAITEGAPAPALPLAAAASALLLTCLAWYRGRALDRGYTATGERVVAITTLTVAAVAVLAAISSILAR
ncbi:DUF202 domain-containing protein [Nocardia halotolerans]|uniref:DUF202 domain-containing protein n=1 Tax=Nocardia halotolerans TaxID=1755878 RepID=A0ABV8VFP2_9NOCA